MVSQLCSEYGCLPKPSARSRDALLDAAETVYLRLDYHDVTAERVAVAAEATSRVVFNTFGNMGWLYRAMIERVAVSLLSRTEQTLASSTAAGTFDALSRHRLAERRRYRLLHSALTSVRCLVPRPAPTDRTLASYYQSLDLAGRGLGRELESAGRIGYDPARLGLAFDRMATACLEYWWQPRLTRDPDRFVARLRDVWQRILSRGDLTSTPAEGESGYQQQPVSRHDLWRLWELILVADGSGGADSDRRLHGLRQKLSRSRAVDPAEVPADVVTMNSRVSFRKTGVSTSATRTLVFPAERVSTQQHISVCEPLGIAMLGSRVGSVVCVNQGDGSQEFLVLDLDYQPESAGHYCL